MANETDQQQSAVSQANAPVSSALPPSIVKIQGHEFNLGQLDETQGAKLFSLLPKHRQKLALELKPFFANFKNAIKDIPPELLEPGAMEKLMETLRKQGGYIANDASKDVIAFFNGPYCAELRRSGLYKGVKSTSEIGQLLASGGAVVTESVSAYISALGLPWRALAAGYNEAKEGIDRTPKLTDAQALALAAAYQGGMYMAIDSEVAPIETKAREPNWADKGKSGFETVWQYIAVFGKAVWNLATQWDSKKDFAANWKSSWETARNEYTDGKGFQTYATLLQESAVERTETQARPQIETMLRGIGTVAGVNAAPYLDALQNNTHYVGYDRKIYQTKDGKPQAMAIKGPDGKPLTQDTRQQYAVDQITGGLFQDIGLNANTTGSVAGVTLAAANYKGVAQGVGAAYANHATTRTDKLLEAAKERVKDLEVRADRAIDGKKPHFWSKKPESLEVLERELEAAEKEVAKLKAQKAALPKDPAASLKADGNWFQRQMGRLAEAAQKELPADAKWPTRFGHKFVEVGEWAGNIIGRAGIVVAHGVGIAAGWVKDSAVYLAKDVPVAAYKKLESFSTGVVHGTAEALLPKKTAKISGLTAGLADIANATEAKAGTIGNFVGKTGDLTLKSAVILNPLMNLAHANAENDQAGMAIYGATAAGAVTAAKVVGRRAVPGLNAGMSGVDLIDGYRTGNGAKTAKAVTELGTIGIGGAIGGILGALGGPLAPATIPAGIAIGASISGWISIGTGMIAERMYEKRQKTVPQEVVSAEQPTGALRADPQLSQVVIHQENRTAQAQAQAAAMQDGRPRGKMAFQPMPHTAIGALASNTPAMMTGSQVVAAVAMSSANG